MEINYFVASWMHALTRTIPPLEGAQHVDKTKEMGR